VYDPAMPLPNGATFAGFTIVRLVGSGGMGEVYLAQHPRLPRRDALKLLPPEWSVDAEYRTRFTREADLASTLWHPHIVGVHDRGEADGQLWISMDYVDGLDAARLLADRYPAGMPVEEVVRIVTAVASGLDYAHKQGLLHRDVKPANIMLTQVDDEGDQRILLTDFGIARDINDISGLTTTNMTVGTVAYSAPEQLMGDEIDGRADQYALAATTYHLLTGSQLFPHSNPAVVISRHLNSPPPALANTRSDLRSLDPVLATALAKDPNDRFARCGEFARALAEHADGSPSPVAPTRPAPVPPRLGPGVSRPATGEKPPDQESAVSPSRGRWLLTAAALTVVLLVIGISLAWHPWARGRSSAKPTTSPSPPSVTSTSTYAPPPAAPPPPPPPIFPANAIDTVLLSPTEIIAGTGSTGPPLEANNSLAGHEEFQTVTPASCSGVMLGAYHGTDSATGLAATRTAILTRAPLSDGRGPTELEQSVSVFDSADDAQTLATSVESQWRACNSGGVGQGSGEDHWTFNFGTLQNRGDVVSVSMAASNIESGGRACQTAIGIRANVVVEAWTCLWADSPIGTTAADPTLAGDNSEQLVAAMLDKVKV
jgi:serine/threonine protein kinase